MIRKWMHSKDAGHKGTSPIYQLSYKRAKEYLRSAKLSNDLLESTFSVYKTVLDKLIDGAGQKCDASDSEAQERSQMYADLLGKWMDVGIKMLSSINASNENR